MRRKVYAILVGLVVAGIYAGQGLAAGGTGGFVEVCKAANPALIGNFQFTIHDGVGDQTTTIAIGTCSQPIAVMPGAVTVTENGSLTGLTNAGTVSSTPDTSFLSATWATVGPTGPGPSGSGFVTSALTVPASTNGSSNVVTVNYADTLVTGVVEVCKSIVTNSGLTGSWQFTITGANGFSQVVSVPAGVCSGPVTVPAGKVKVQETGDASENVTAITATQTAANTNAILGPLAGPAPDLPNATVVAAVTAGDASMQTIVTMTNDSVRLKLCKYVDQGLTNTTAPGNSQFPFTFAATGNAGPNGPIAPLSLAAGNTFATAVCTVVGTFRAGTTVTITETPVVGTKVGSINVSPTTNPYGGGPVIVPGSLSLPNRTLQVVLGPGETVVTYEDIPALPGTLKLCKVAGTLVAAGTPFTFTVNSSTVTVPAGSCVVVGSFPFWTHVNVTEAAAPNITVASITAIPSFAVVLEGGVPTDTSTPVLSNVNLGTRSSTVLIGENNVTELTYTNNDPPDQTSTPSGGTTTSGSSTSTSGSGTASSGTASNSSAGSSNSGGGGGGGSSSSTTGSTTSTSSTPSGSGTAALAVVPATTGVGLGTTAGTTSTSASVKAQLAKATKLAALKKTLALDKGELKKLVAKLHATKDSKTKHHLNTQINAVKGREAKVALQIIELER